MCYQIKTMPKANHKSKRGGARPGAGRKKADDPKIPVTIYVRKSRLKAMGGLSSAKAKLTKVAEATHYDSL